MRNKLAFLAAAVLTFIGVGWYGGWYTMHTSLSARGYPEINIELKDDKIKADLEKIAETLGEIGDKKSNPGAGTGRSNPGAPKVGSTSGLGDRAPDVRPDLRR